MNSEILIRLGFKSGFMFALGALSAMLAMQLLQFGFGYLSLLVSSH